MSEHPEHANGFVNPSVKYEHSDLSLRAVLTFSGALVAVLVVVSIGLYFMIPAMLGPTSAQEPLAAWKSKPEVGPNPNASHLPAQPELEAIDRTAPPKDGQAHTRPIQEQIAAEEKILNAPAGLDKDSGKIHIPIEDAMKIVAAPLEGKP